MLNWKVKKEGGRTMANLALEVIALKNGCAVLMIYESGRYVYSLYENAEQMDKTVHLFVSESVNEGDVVCANCSIGHLPSVRKAVEGKGGHLFNERMYLMEVDRQIVERVMEELYNRLL